jgi:hypothetical protein
MKIVSYGRLADRTAPQLEFDVPLGCSIGDVRTRLAMKHHAAADILLNKYVRECVAGSMVTNEDFIATKDQVVFLAAVTSG